MGLFGTPMCLDGGVNMYAEGGEPYGKGGGVQIGTRRMSGCRVPSDWRLESPRGTMVHEYTEIK